MSERAQRILTWLREQNTQELPIRQQSLAEQFNCSRRTIGRALKELKEANLIVDLNKRHENRCKIYLLSSFADLSPVALAKGEATADKTPTIKLGPEAERQLKLYRYTFECVFRNWPDWETYYPRVTRELAYETDIHRLWRQTFDKLYVIRDREMGLKKVGPVGIEPTTAGLRVHCSTN